MLTKPDNCEYVKRSCRGSSFIVVYIESFTEQMGVRSFVTLDSGDLVLNPEQIIGGCDAQHIGAGPDRMHEGTVFDLIELPRFQVGGYADQIGREIPIFPAGPEDIAVRNFEWVVVGVIVIIALFNCPLIPFFWKCKYNPP